jgi:hypothetical protein
LRRSTAPWGIFEHNVLEPGHDDLDALLERWLTDYEREVFPGGCLVITAGMESANRDGAVHDALAAALERQLTALQRAVACARDDGRPSVATDAGQLAFELHAVLTAGNQCFRISRDPQRSHTRAEPPRGCCSPPPDPPPLAGQRARAIASSGSVAAPWAPSRLVRWLSSRDPSSNQT